tara:strand:- start:134 stop:553 length:420 start_codon:yes stop_codon:yes gene_type:complete
MIGFRKIENLRTWFRHEKDADTDCKVCIQFEVGHITFSMTAGGRITDGCSQWMDNRGIFRKWNVASWVTASDQDRDLGVGSRQWLMIPQFKDNLWDGCVHEWVSIEQIQLWLEEEGLKIDGRSVKGSGFKKVNLENIDD